MTSITVGQKIHFVERLRTSVAINKQASLVVAKAWGWWNKQKNPDHLQFLSSGPQVVVQPCLRSPPYNVPNMTRWKKGSLDVVGYIDNIEKRRVGWSGGGNWVVRCECGRYEHRTGPQLRKKAKKEYIDACSWCKGVWAEYVKNEHEKTGIWPPGGGPTFRASKLRVDIVN